MSSNSSDNSSNNNANSTENSVTKGTLEKSKDTKRCEQRLEFTIAKNKNVHRLLEAIEGLGCKLPTDFFACR